MPDFKERPGLALWTMQVLLKQHATSVPDVHSGGDAGDAGDASGGFELSTAEQWQIDGEVEEEGGRAPPAWHGDLLQPLSASLDEVVFLYKAVGGVCTDSFGSHCAAASNMPHDVISRALHVSRCRLGGRPVERLDADPAATQAKEFEAALLVDAFLQFDLRTGNVAQLMTWPSSPPS